LFVNLECIMRHRFVLTGAALLAAAGSFAGVARAQDSVSTSNGLPGDALSAYLTGGSQTQVQNYIVDLTGLTSSWGNRYLIGPIAKASRSTTTSPTYFNHLIGPTVASNRFGPVQAFVRPTYRLWTQAGGGVNATSNNLALTTLQNVTAMEGQTFGVSFMEFAGGPNGVFGDSDDENNVITAMAGFVPGNNARLYVSRIVAATNRANANAGVTGNASFGLGGVDEAGNTLILADNFNMNAGDDPVVNKQVIRVAALSRSTAFNNLVTNSAFGDTTSGVSRRLLITANNLVTPTVIPPSIAGRAVALVADFNNTFFAEQFANSMSAAAGWMVTGANARGPVSYTGQTFAHLSNGVNDAGTGAALSRGASATKTRGLSAWGLNLNGTVDSALRVELPTAAGALIDQADGFSPANAFGSLGNQEFTNYQSQVCFRGANGPVALTVLPDGDLLMAAGVAGTGPGAAVPQSKDSYIAVARVKAKDASVQWTIAAHSGDTQGSAGGLSKAILGSPNPGHVIGRLARYDEVFPGATSGPSISAPAMDRLGNVYFMSSIRLFRPPINEQNNDLFTVGLLRANFDPDTNAYHLELLTKLDDVFPGLNSGRNYQVQFFGPADADSVDSGAIWHSSIVQDLSARCNTPDQILQTSPITLGALVFRAKIVYDLNNDGVYADPSTPQGAGSPDQAYNVVMAVLPRFRPSDIAATDASPGADGRVDNGDFALFISAFFTGDLLADIAATDASPGPDGNIDNGDFALFISDFFGGN
jgi:hypothetical protein